jgi:hypothetical protein
LPMALSLRGMKNPLSQCRPTRSQLAASLLGTFFLLGPRRLRRGPLAYPCLFFGIIIA